MLSIATTFPENNLIPAGNGDTPQTSISSLHDDGMNNATQINPDSPATALQRYFLGDFWDYVSSPCIWMMVISMVILDLLYGAYVTISIGNGKGNARPAELSKLSKKVRNRVHGGHE